MGVASTHHLGVFTPRGGRLKCPYERGPTGPFVVWVGWVRCGWVFWGDDFCINPSVGS